MGVSYERGILVVVRRAAAEGAVRDVQGYLAHKKTPPPLGSPEGPRPAYRRVLGGGRFLIRKVTLWCDEVDDEMAGIEQWWCFPRRT